MRRLPRRRGGRRVGSGGGVLQRRCNVLGAGRGGEPLRRALEGEVHAGATKSAAMFKAFEELKEVFSSA